MADQFKIETSNYLAYDYRAFLERLRGLALSQPREYVKYRNDISQKVRDNLVRNWYESVYKMLVDGTDTAGVPLADQLGDGAGRLGKPNFPRQEASKFALGAAATLERIASELIDKLAGIDFDKLSTAQLAKKSSTLGI